VTDDENADSGDPASQIYRWKDLEEDTDPEALQKVAQAIESRDRVSCTAQTAHLHMHDSSDGFVHLLPSDKDIVWRVRVKVRTSSQCLSFCILICT
jgi:hypothetical protein